MSWLITLFIFLFVSITPVAAQQGSLIVVNQVRGTECCEAGTLENLELQLKTAIASKIPMTFALRYDALDNPEMLSILQKYQLEHPELIHIAGFLEITPSLARDAQVVYLAAERDWYKTEHVYPPGYSVPGRSLIVDTYMAKYKSIFTAYPSLTVGWFVDTTTLNYLHDKYGVKIHELTREQWGTDSYTLDGGSFPYPYYASRNWSFIPSAFDSGLIIIRQTVPHAAQNYGDHTSGATSQPNDYLRSHTTSYFHDLINSLSIQPTEQKGFGVLGIENSFEGKYQQEFIDGLLYIKANLEGKLNYIHPDQIEQVVAPDQVKIYQDKSDDMLASWIITNHYRLRILSTSSKIMITDMRLYSDQLLDPYAKDKLIGGGYWVAPYLINGSRWFAQKQFWLKQILDPVYNEGYGARSDLTTNPSNLALPTIDKTSTPLWSRDGNNLILTYNSAGLPIKFIFEQNHWTTSGFTANKLHYQDNSGSKFKLLESKNLATYSLSFVDDGKVVYGLQVDCKRSDCSFRPQLDSDAFTSARDKFPFLFAPHINVSDDLGGTLIYPSSEYLIHGRSPARLVVIPRSSSGSPAVLPEVVEFEHSSDLVALGDPLVTQGEETQFYDFEASSPGKYNLKVTVPRLPSREFNFRFSPDCRQNLSTCLKRPKYLYWYLRAVIHGRLLN